MYNDLLFAVSMPQAALGAHQQPGTSPAPSSSFNAASGTWRASTLSTVLKAISHCGFQCRKRHLARINKGRYLKYPIKFQCRKRHLARINHIFCYLTALAYLLFQCRKRHLARINLLERLIESRSSFNAASGTWRASTVPCLKPHDTWPDRAILT